MHTNADVMELRGTDAAEEILKTVNKENIDTIVLGSRGVGETRESLLGSITYKVSHSADRPIIIVR